MNDKSSKLLNVLISYGIAFFAICSAVIYVNLYQKSLNILVYSFLGIQILLGLLIFLYSIIKTKKAYHFYIGSLFICWGVLTIFIIYNPNLLFKMFWPIYGVIAGIIFLISGFLKYTKIKFGYLIPGFTLIGMGVWYSMFSFKIIKVPFLTVAGFAGPLFLLGIALSLIFYFYAQQKHKTIVVKDDVAGDFSDEESIDTKED